MFIINTFMTYCERDRTFFKNVYPSVHCTLNNVQCAHEITFLNVAFSTKLLHTKSPRLSTKRYTNTSVFFSRGNTFIYIYIQEYSLTNDVQITN